MVPDDFLTIKDLIKICPLSWEKRESLAVNAYPHSYELELEGHKIHEDDQSREVVVWLRSTIKSFYSWKIVARANPQSPRGFTYALHMSFDDPADAMLARLTWSDLRKVDVDD